MYFYL
jgi:serine/threonine protein kinase